MSFILDQLKKSGKQRALEVALRRQTEKPGAKTTEPLLVRSAARTSVRVKKWQFAAVAALIGTVVVYGAFSSFRGTSSMRQPVIPAAKGSVPEASQLPAVSSSSPSIQIPVASVEEKIMSQAKSPATEQKQIATEKAVKHVPVPDKGRNVSEKAGTDSSAEARGKRAPDALMDAPVGVEASGSVPAGSVLEFKQLPQTVRNSLPEIRVTSHLYKKDSRLVSINGRIMSEGYNMDDGLYLEEITPEGVILSYGKHRFLVRPER